MAIVSEESLDKTVTDEDVHNLASLMVNWEVLRIPLGLNRAKQKEIEDVRGYDKQKRECLEEWREKAGEKATYRVFIGAARSVQHNALADKVLAMLHEREKLLKCTL